MPATNIYLPDLSCFAISSCSSEPFLFKLGAAPDLYCSMNIFT